jgi:ribosomal protein S27E
MSAEVTCQICGAAVPTGRLGRHMLDQLAW